MHNELLPWLEQKAIEAEIKYGKEYDLHDRGEFYAYCNAIAKLTAENIWKVRRRIICQAEGISEEEGMYCTPYDPETDTEYM